MSIYVTAINGMGSGEDSGGGALQNLKGMQDGDIMYASEDIFNVAGVHDISDTDFEVVENAPADKSVDVAAGTAYVLNSAYSKNSSNTKYWRVVNDAIVNVTIPDNVSGNPRIDLIAIKVDTGASPDDDASNVATIVNIQGTPAGAPVAPALPADHLKLAEIAVADGFTSIVTANITDTRVQVALRPEALRDGAIISNNTEIKGETVAGSPENMMHVSTANNLVMGDSNLNGFQLLPQLTFRATLSADQTGITSGADRLITLNAASYDPNSDFDTGNNRYVVPVTGVYLIAAQFRAITVTAGSDITLRVKNNGTNIIDNQVKNIPGSSHSIAASIIIDLTAGDFIDLHVNHDDGTNIDINSLNSQTFLSGAKLF